MIHVEYRFQYDTYDVFVYKEVTEDSVSYLTIDPVTQLEVWSKPEGRFMMQKDLPKPAYSIRAGVARDLVTQMLRLGVTPAERSKIEGQYEAQSKHLADLQRLVFREKRS